MKPNPSSLPPSSTPAPGTEEQAIWSDIATQLQQVEQSLQEVKARFEQIQAGEQDRDRLQQQQQELKAQLREQLRDRPPALAAKQQELREQLRQLASQLSAIETEIESRLIADSTLREIFWQVVRFTGLGVLLGVLLKSCIGA